jgi:LDH2 family malate/lactate/ureidoglycolate dehydrogenase
MIAIDLSKAIGSDAFSHRLDDLLQRLNGLPMKDGAPHPRFPGERRWRLRRDRIRGGMPIAVAEVDDVMGLAKELGIDPA